MIDVADGVVDTPTFLYVPALLSATVADRVFADLRDSLDWVRHDGVPRCEYYSNDTAAPYSYGVREYARVYQPQPWSDSMLEVRAAVESVVAATMDVCFLNMYLDQRDSLGWHADDSPEMDDARPIVSVSLGAVRDIQLRSNDGGDVETVTLAHGSMFAMKPGVQDTHRHRIPKSGFHIGERISLTFRGFVPL